MKKRVLCLLVDGFEEIETVTPIDLLHRADIEVTVASLNPTLQATGRSNITIIADQLLDHTIHPEDFDLLLIPGGPGVATLRQDGRAAILASEFHTSGKPIAAICAAPLILHDAGLLNHGVRHTAHFSCLDTLTEATGDRVVIDNHLITSRGAGTSIDFTLAIITTLAGPETAREITTSIMA